MTGLLFWFRRNGVMALYLCAAAVLLAASALPGRAHVLREIVMVRDVSASLGPDGQPVPDFVQAQVSRADVVHVVTVAASAMRQIGGAGNTQQDVSATDYEAGLRLAAAIPRDGRTRRRILLIGDGRATRGSAEAVAGSLAGEAVLDVVPVGHTPRPDVRVLSFRAETPSGVPLGHSARLYAELDCTDVCEATVECTDDAGRTVGRKSVSVYPGGGGVWFEIPCTRTGLHVLEARAHVLGDAVPENDAARVAVIVRAPSRVLALGEGPLSGLDGVEHAENLSDALAPEMLGRFTCLALQSIPATSLPPASADRIRRAIRDGLGLIVIASERGLAADGYARPWGGEAAMEELLPVRSVPRNSLAVAVAIDTSGSMSDPVVIETGTVSKLSVAEAALAELWSRLNEEDYFGVSRFTVSAHSVLPLNRRGADEKGLARLREAAQGLGASGGTSIFAGAQEALSMVREARVRKRLAVLVTDGDTVETGEALETAMRELETTARNSDAALLVIAVGESPNRALLARMQSSFGAYVLYLDNVETLPAILWQEVNARRDAVRLNGRIGKAHGHPVTSGLSPVSMPAAGRYVALGPVKFDAGAEALLETSDGDPLVAAWRLGLGRVVVFAGDPIAAWDWKGQGQRLLQQSMAWCSAVELNGTLQTRISRSRIVVEYGGARTQEDSGDRKLVVSLVPREEGGAVAEAALSRTAPGIWQGSVPRPPAGVYRMTVRSASTTLAESALVVDDREEWLRFGVDGQALAALALTGGGRVAHGAEQFTPWEVIPVAGQETHPVVSPALLMVGAVLLLLGLAWSAWR